jgi:hypothetical protein
MSLNIFLKKKFGSPSANFKIIKGKNDDDIKILGGTIQFDGDVERFPNQKKTPSDITYLLSKPIISISSIILNQN